ncbi:MAG: NUDIX hydrolase [Candidatus Norongarragalinales archaeon]
MHVFLVNPHDKSVYIQKRSETKSYLPGFYCTSAGGHVQTGESYEQAAARELNEELGLQLPLRKIHETNFVLDNQNRFIHVFAAFSSETPRFADGEVAGGSFMSFDEAMALVAAGEKIHPQLDLCFRWLYANKEKIF